MLRVAGGLPWVAGLPELTIAIAAVILTNGAFVQDAWPERAAVLAGTFAGGGRQRAAAGVPAGAVVSTSSVPRSGPVGPGGTSPSGSGPPPSRRNGG
jgi:hypothetical protein